MSAGAVGALVEADAVAYKKKVKRLARRSAEEEFE